MVVKAVLFDYGGVIAFHATTILGKKMYDKFGISKNELIEFWRKIEDDFDIGKIKERNVWGLFKKEYKLKTSVKKLEKLHKSAFITRKTLLSLAKSLSNKTTVGIFSNMPKEISNYLRAKDDLSFFHYIFFSGELGMIKPHKKYYLYAAKKMKLKPSEIVFIDDKMVNIKGARNAGMKGFQFKSVSDTRKQLRKLGIK